MYNQVETSPYKSIAIILLLMIMSTVIVLFNMEAKALIAVIGLGVVALVWARPHYGILLFLTTFLITYGSLVKGMGKLTPNNVIGLIFCLLLVNKFIQEQDIWFIRVRQIQLMIGIAGIFLVATWLEPQTPAVVKSIDYTQKELWNYFTNFAFVIFMIHFIETRHHLTLVFGLLLALILITVPSGIHVAFTGGSEGDSRAAASFGIQAAANSNRLAYFCIMAMSIVWYLRLELATYNGKLIAAGTIALLLFTVFLSASRNGLLMLVILSLITMIESGVDVRKIIATMFLLVTLSVVIIMFVPEKNIERMTSFDTQDTETDAGGSGQKRVGTIHTGLKMFFDSSPIYGIGPGNFKWVRYLYYDHKKIATHNSYLWAMLSGGIVGLTLYLALFWTTFKELRWMEQMHRPSNVLPALWMIKSIRTSFILFIIFSLFAEVFLDIYIFLFVGLTIIMKRLYEKDKFQRQMMVVEQVV
jgi:hypothetical protein